MHACFSKTLVFISDTGELTRIDALDIDNYMIKYTLIEGPMLGDKLEDVHYACKFEDTSDGGCIIKLVSEYHCHTKGDIQLKEDDIKAGKNRNMGFYRAIEEYLLAHPQECD